MKNIDTAFIKTKVYYDPSSPSCLRWKETLFVTVKGKLRPHHFCVKDMPAGSIGSHGYWEVRINKVLYLAHRIVYLLNNDEFYSDSFIDHVDGNRINNNIDNLRVVSRAINNRNQKKRKRKDFTIDGILFKASEVPMGISWDSKRGRWIASYVELDGSKIQKQFNPTAAKYRSEESPLFSAYNDAIFWRSNMIDSLNSNGAGYTETHGVRDSTNR